MPVGKPLNKGYQTDNSGAKSTSIHIEMPPLPDETPITPEIVPAIAPEEPQQQQYSMPEEPDADEQEYEDSAEETIEDKPSKTAYESFREVRQAKEKAESERNELMLKMQKLQQDYIDSMKNKNQEKTEEPDDLDLEIDPETLVEGKHLKKYINQMKDMRKEIKVYKQQSQEIELQNKIRSRYPDFEDVLNAQSVQKLNQTHPEVATALSNIPSDYDKAVADYEFIKNINVREGTMKKIDKSMYQDKERALDNAKKPRPLASVSPQQGDTPLSKANAFANGLTDELKEQLRKEMYTARRSH